MIEVRQACADDLDGMVELLGQLEEVTETPTPVSRPTVQRTYEAMLRSPQIYRNYVAVEGRQVLGLISLVLYKTLLHERGTALINELVVAGEARRQGIGRRLVQTAIAAARECGMDEIEVGTETGNEAARHFYGEVGFDREYVLFGMEF